MMEFLADWRGLVVLVAVVLAVLLELAIGFVVDPLERRRERRAARLSGEYLRRLSEHLGVNVRPGDDDETLRRRCQLAMRLPIRGAVRELELGKDLDA